MDLFISRSVTKKLAEKHGVSESDIRQCFGNRECSYLKDTREEHRTDPPTVWFIAETDFGRRLKIVFVQEVNGRIFIKTAFEPNQQEMDIYRRFSSKKHSL